jgi:serine/threonine protein kinase
MLTGRPPFVGATALDVITKHMCEPVTPPDRIVGHVPQYLSRVILKMLAKKPQDRYQDMNAVIAALEEFAGVQTSGPFTPSGEQIKTLTACVMNFTDSAAAKLRLLLIRLFGPLCAVLFIGAFFLRSTRR